MLFSLWKLTRVDENLHEDSQSESNEALLDNEKAYPSSQRTPKLLLKSAFATSIIGNLALLIFVLLHSRNQSSNLDPFQKLYSKCYFQAPILHG